MKGNKLSVLTVLLGLVVSFPALAGISVIVNPENNVELTAKEVRAIYLAKTNAFPSGEKVQPLDVNNNDDIKHKFSKDVLRKSPSSLNSYWSRMIFSAKGTPPQSLSMSAVKAKVANDKSAIGYIDSSLVDSSVKVVYSFE